VGTGRYGVLLWHSNGSPAPTELHLPASFDPATTTVVSGLATVHGLPAYDKGVPLAASVESGGTGSRRLLLLLLTAPTGTHFALVTDGATALSGALLRAARAELATWASKAARIAETAAVR
jgi:hypothetical protein